MLWVTTQSVAFRATVTGAEEGHVCAEKNAVCVCVCSPSGDSHTGVGEGGRFRFLRCCVYAFFLYFWTTKRRLGKRHSPTNCLCDANCWLYWLSFDRKPHKHVSAFKKQRWNFESLLTEDIWQRLQLNNSQYIFTHHEVNSSNFFSPQCFLTRCQQAPQTKSLGVNKAHHTTTQLFSKLALRRSKE